jgi:hypothetical protein
MKGLEMIVGSTPFCAFRLSLVVCGFILSGCFTGSDEIVQKSSATWTKRDCMTVLISAMAHNLFDNRNNIKVVATPYVPRVIEALTRLDQLGDPANVDSVEFGKQYDALLRASTGLLYDWEKGLKYSTTHQRYYRHLSDVDSLLFLITLMNNAWPCQPILISTEKEGIKSLTVGTDWPCYTPSLGNLEDHIVLVNDRGDSLNPKYVWGVKNAQLTTEEHLLVMFSFTGVPEKHFFSNSESMTLLINSFSPSIGYKYSIISLMDR